MIGSRRCLVQSLLVTGYILFASATSWGEPVAERASDAAIRLGATQVHHLKVGIRIKAQGACRNVTASVPVPMDWPEQKVQIVDEEISAEVRSVKYQPLQDGVKRMLLIIPRLNPGETAEAVLTLAIERQVIEPPLDTSMLSVPTRPPREIRKYLGDSPFIESRHAQIRKLARQISNDHEGDAWSHVKAIYDHVRQHVQYRESPLKGAVNTLADGIGDCEAMTSLFIALCRASKIPSRMVWVTDHSYPEFYLVDDQKQGHWYPCQISGAEAFGQMPETRPIIQKGDNYKIPETRERRRYVAVQLKAGAVKGRPPQISEVMEFVSPDAQAGVLP